VIGLSENYVIILNVQFKDYDSLKVFRAVDGQLIHSYDIQWQFGLIQPDQLLNLKPRNEIVVHVNKNLFAFRGKILGSHAHANPNPIPNPHPHPHPNPLNTDLYILDFKTGEVILGVEQDLNFSKVENFFMLEDKLIFEDADQIIMTKFWI
jgi:hypothetical protein